jgi:outer membrane protein
VAQTKVGTIDSEYIVNFMPEREIATKMAQKYGAKLDSSFSIKVEDFKSRLADYQAKEKEMGVLEKKTIQTELTNLEEDIKQYQKNGNTLMGLKRDELMRPLYAKLSSTIAEISKANGYTQILTTTGNQFAYLDMQFDITDLVIKKLDLTIPKPTE